MQDGDACHAIPTDDAHLDPAAIGSTRDNRNDGALWKDDVLDGLVGLSDHVAPLQLDHLKLGLNEGQIVRREGAQQGVVDYGRLGVTNDGQMRRLRHGAPTCWGGSTCLSQPLAARINRQRIWRWEPQEATNNKPFSLCAF